MRLVVIVVVAVVRLLPWQQWWEEADFVSVKCEGGHEKNAPRPPCEDVRTVVALNFDVRCCNGCLLDLEIFVIAAAAVVIVAMTLSNVDDDDPPKPSTSPPNSPTHPESNSTKLVSAVWYCCFLNVRLVPIRFGSSAILVRWRWNGSFGRWS